MIQRTAAHWGSYLVERTADGTPLLVDDPQDPEPSVIGHGWLSAMQDEKVRIARRPNRHHPELPARLKRYNRLIARRRAAVETTFATLKNRMKLTLIRYVGLAKAAAQVTMASSA